MRNKINGFWLSPTYGCNNRCRYCYVGGKLGINRDADLGDLERYVKQMVSLGAKNCILIGGEPTTYPNLTDLVRFASNLGLSVKMVTNGRRLADPSFVMDLKSAGLQHCTISLEGLEPVHDGITQVAGSFSQSVAGICNCREKGIAVNSITTVSCFNKGTIEDLVIFLRSLKVRRSIFNMCSSQPSGYKGQIGSGVLSLAEYARIVESVGLRHEGLIFYTLVPLCLFDQAKLQQLVELGRVKTTCSLFSRVVAIDPEGNILPCTHMAGINYGNLNDPDSYSGLIARKEAEIEYLKTHAPSDRCVSCQLWNRCLGGCNLIWFSHNAQECIPGLPNIAS